MQGEESTGESAGARVYRFKTLVQESASYKEKDFEVKGPLYHGGGKRLRAGDQIKPGRKTNSWGDEGDVSRHVFFTTSLGTAAAYAVQTGGHVFEVEPTGDFRMDYSGDDYKSPHPLNVIRKLNLTEWQ